MLVNNRELGFNDESEFSAVQNHPVLSYIVLQIIPIFFYFCPHIRYFDFDFSYLIFTTLEIIEFIIVKNQIGFELIGINWFIDPNSDEIIQFSNRQAPYVPKVNESNIFWISFFVEIALWIMGTIGSIAQKSLSGFLISVLVTAMYLTNLLIFMKGQSKTQKAVNDFARNAILTESVEFAQVQEHDEEIESNEETEETA